MSKQPFFKLPYDLSSTVELLTDQEAGKFLKHLFKYVNGKPEEPEELKTKIAYITTVNYIKRNCFQFRPTSVYVFLLENEKESFIKVGISTNIIRRLDQITKESGYKVTCLASFEYEDTPKALISESKAHNQIKEYSYKPNNYFMGFTECFTINSLEKLHI